jgi:branched-subunit amino acid ABC-type transport system permease component
MRIREAILTAFALALSLGALAGMTYSELYQHAASAESAGFDALAHDVFNGSKMACADGQAAEGSAQ